MWHSRPILRLVLTHHPMTTLICNCNQTLPLQTPKLGQALGEDLKEHTTLCRREAGAFLQAARGGEPLDESAYSDEWIDGVIAEHDARFARYRGDIPDSAEVVESLRPVGGTERLVLRWPKATVVDSVTVDGTALADDYWELRDGMLCGIDYCWPRRLLVVVTYTHGWDSPDDLKRSCALFVEKTAAPLLRQVNAAARADLVGRGLIGRVGPLRTDEGIANARRHQNASAGFHAHHR